MFIRRSTEILGQLTTFWRCTAHLPAKPLRNKKDAASIWVILYFWGQPAALGEFILWTIAKEVTLTLFCAWKLSNALYTQDPSSSPNSLIFTLALLSGLYLCALCLDGRRACLSAWQELKHTLLSKPYLGVTFPTKSSCDFWPPGYAAFKLS